MKTNVNLYQAKFQPTLRLFNLAITIRLWAVGLLVTILAYAYLNLQQQQMHQELTSAKEQLRQQDLLVSELQLAINNQQADPKLLSIIEKNQAILSSKQRVLKELSGQESLKSNGFSTIMLELAKNHPKGLWLTHINLDGTSVLIEGAASDSAIIPVWVDSLGTTAYFKGQQFADTRVYRDENQQLNFVITSGKGSTAKQEVAGE